MAPVVETGLQRLFDQQASKARTVEEQVAGNDRAIFQGERGDEAAFGVLFDADDLALPADHAAFFAVTAQIGGIEAGVELEGVVDLRGVRPGGAGKAVFHRGRRFGIIASEVGRPAHGGEAQPEIMEADAVHVAAVIAERMEIAAAGCLPVDEIDAQLVCSVGLTDELVLVQPQQVVEGENRRYRRLADADRADLGGFDQGDVVIDRAERLGKQGRRHPSGGAAADDHDAFDGNHGQVFLTQSLSGHGLPGRRRANSSLRPVRE